MHEDVEYFLAHHGVKGMKWGVRKARAFQKRVDTTKRVATGTASVRDYVSVGLTTSPLSFAYNRGSLQRVAAKRVTRDRNIQAQIDTLSKGKKAAANLLLQYNGLRVKNLNFDTSDPSTFTRKSKGRSNLIDTRTTGA